MNERRAIQGLFTIRSNTVAFLLFIQVTYLVSALINARYQQSASGLDPWLWQVVDPPSQSNGALYEIQSLWGGHYFGDLQDLLTSASWANPWGLSPTQHLPVGLAVVSIFGVFGQGLTAVTFIATSCMLFFGLVHVWTKGETISSKLTMLVTLLPLNISALLVLDRGNLLLVAIPLIGIASHRLLIDEKKDFGTLLLIVLAVSLKSFLIIPVFAIIFLAKNRLKIYAYFLVLIGILNLVLMYSYSGPVFQNFFSFISTTIRYADHEAKLVALRSVSSTYRLSLELADRWQIVDSEMKLLAMLSGAAWLVLVISILLIKRVPLWMKIMAAFSTVQMVVTGGPYVLVWGIMAILVLPTESESKDWRSTTIATLVTIAVLISNLPIPNKLMFSPIAWTFVVVTIIICYGSHDLNFRKVKHKEIV